MEIGSSSGGNYPRVTKWDFPENIEFVGLQVWQSTTAFHSLEVITLDSQCVKAAQDRAKEEAKEEESLAIITTPTTPTNIVEEETQTDKDSAGLKLEIIILLALVAVAIILITTLIFKCRLKRN